MFFVSEKGNIYYVPLESTGTSKEMSLKARERAGKMIV
jgi:hypothetical protein